MTSPTLDELRELSRRSRRAHGWGILAIVGALLLLPLSTLASSWAPQAWVQYGAVTLGGALFLAYGYHAGKERGAFRRVFRRIKDENRARRLAPEAPAAAPVETSVVQLGR